MQRKAFLAIWSGKVFLTVLCTFLFLVQAPLAQSFNENEFLYDEHIPDELAEVERYREVLELKWEEVLSAVREKDYLTIDVRSQELNTLKFEAGFESLEDYSTFFLAKSLERLKNNDIQHAGFYVRKALELSPTSPEVLFRSMRLARRTGVESSSTLFLTAFRSLFHYPHLFLKILKSTIYPALLALTIGLYLSFALFLVFRYPGLVHGGAKFFPKRVRGYFAPLLVTILLISCCFLDPLWCLLFWALIVLVLLPGRIFLIPAVAFVMIAWGVFIPIRENIDTWLRDPSVQRMLEVHSGSFNASDKGYLERLQIRRSFDGVVFFTASQLYRRYGDFNEAERTLLQAEELMGSTPEIEVQRGMIFYLQENYEKANEAFSRALDLGMDSAGFYFNYAKSLFQTFDTSKSDEYQALAREKDRVLTDWLGQREESLGKAGDRVLSEIHLPLNTILSSALMPLEEAKKTGNIRASAIMSGMTPERLLIAGLVLLGLFGVFASSALGRERRAMKIRQEQPRGVISALVQIFPGGGLILCGRPGTCFLVLASCLFLAMPLLQWPDESAVLLNLIPGYGFYYTSFVVCVVLFGITIGVLAARDEH